MLDADRRFVLHSWLSSMYQPQAPELRASELVGLSLKDAYEKLDNRIHPILRKASTHVLIALSPIPQDGKDYLYGFLAYEIPNVIHYVYIKSAWRTFGLATALVTEAKLHSPYVATFASYALAPLSKKYPIVYNPLMRENTHAT